MDTKKRKIIERFWLEKLDGELAKISLPLVIKGPESRKFVSLEIPGNIHNNLEEISKGSDMVLYLLFLSGLNVVLHKYTGIEDLLIGTLPPKGKGLREEIVFFRNRITGDLTFKEYINQVKEVVLDAFNHVQEEYSFNDIYNKLCARKGAASLDIFNIGFIYEKFQDRDKLHRFQSFDLLFTLSDQDKRRVLEVEYNTGLYPDEMVRQFSRHVVDLFAGISSLGDAAISHIDILGYEERKRLLVEFNDTKKDYPGDKTIHELFEEQVERTPDNIAVLDEKNQLTYRQLNEKANQLAGILRKKGSRTDRIVGLMAERSAEMVVGILAILKSGGAYLPIDPEFPGKRKRYLVEDSQARELLTCEKYIHQAEFSETVIDIDAVIGNRNQGDPGNLKNFTGSDDLAYVMYTSGTTGRPKAVMVEHRSVVRLVKNANFLDFKEEQRLLQTGALAFDASTLEIWGPLLNGSRLYLRGREIILSPQRLRETIEKHHISTMWMTSPLFNQMVMADIEIFGSLKYLLVGGDVLNPVQINRVREGFPGLHVINGYGPTENTTFSTTFLIDKEYKESIPIGSPISNSTAYIVDSFMRPVPVGVPGELMVGGDGVSRGYLNNPELTREKFAGNPFAVGNMLYKTGDLACWLPDGNIEFLGRMDEQVKLRGYRIEMGEIENHLTAHPVVRDAVVRAAFLTRGNAAGGEADKQLCAYIVPEVGENLDGPALCEYLSLELPDYMIPSFFVQLEKIPLTSNGKVDVRALPVPDVVGAGIKYAAPENQVQKQLVELWADVLGIDGERIGIDFDFFDLGGHSLKATILISKLHRVFHVNVPLLQIFQTPTIRELAQYIRDAVKEKYAAVEPVEEREYYPISPAQKRLYILQKMDPDNITYNLPLAYVLEGDPDRERLEDAFNRLIKRHESFRTCFLIVEDEPVQKILEAGDVELEIEYNEPEANSNEQYAKEEEEKLVRDFVWPFDLTEAPLLRVGLIKTAEENHILILDMHHIVSDGTSMGVIIEDFMRIYAGNPLPELRIQYKDYSGWQGSSEVRNAIKGQQDFWLKAFTSDDQLPVLSLPLDYKRPTVQSFEGNILDFEISGEETRGLKELAAGEEVTLFMMLLSIYYVFLSKLSGQEDIVVGSPIAARRHADLQDIVGMFVNTLPLRNVIRGEKSFNELLIQVKQKTLLAFENQDYPFEELVEEVVESRDVSRNPLFDVLFTLLNLDMLEMKIPGLSLRHYRYESVISKFALTLFAFESEEKISFTIEYCTKLFKEETILRFIRYFKRIVSTILEEPSKKISGIEIVLEDEKRQILEVFNNTGTQYLEEKAICQLFEEQVGRTPDGAAVVCKAPGTSRRKQSLEERRAITYRELNEKSHQLAHLLKEKGVEANTIVGLMVERSIEMVIGMLGILKAGGAYLPIDTSYPLERIDFMLKDSNAKILVSELSKKSELSKGTEMIDVNSVIVGDEDAEPTDLTYPTYPTHPTHLCYVIYTSGTTGTPKGVLIRHRGLINLVRFHRTLFGEAPGSRVSQVASPAFDAMAFEVWPCLVSGASLYIADNEIRMNPAQMKEWLIGNGITISFQSTAMAEQLLEEEWPEEGVALRVLRTAGDRLKKYLQHRCPFRFYNLYGPTEDTVWTTWTEVEVKVKAEPETDIERYPTIGKPISNHQVYTLSPDLTLQPIGVMGELCIAGEGLAVGYLNNPELTAEKFIKFSFNTQHSTLNTRLYRTGDLVQWLPDGDIEFLGRMDHQVKIRGFRIEPGEIEWQLLNHLGISEALVLAKKDNRDAYYLCAYVVLAEGTVLGKASSVSAELKEYLSCSLPGYMIPSFLVQLERMSLTPSGKVDLKALPAPEVETGDTYAAPRDYIEEQMVELWAEVLGLEKELIGIDSNFFEIGGHSLKATILMTKIHKHFDVRVDLTEIFVNPFVRTLARRIRESQKEKYVPLVTGEEKEYYPLSYAQRRLWILCQFEEDSSAYNIPDATIISGKLDIEIYRWALQVLVDRHESLRTVFAVVGGKPVQKIIKNLKYEAEEIDLRHLDAASRGQKARELFTAGANNVFDLDHGPLILFQCIRLEDEKYLFVNNIHHIIADGWSIGIIHNEIFTLYNAFLKGEISKNLPPPLEFQYKDYSRWHNALIEGDHFSKSERYWLEKFNDKPNGVELPLDHPRRPVQTFNGSRVYFIIDEERTGRLNRLGLEYEGTLFMCFLTILKIFLMKYSGQTDILVGSPIAGRKLSELHAMIGFLVNTIVFRAEIDPGKSFVQLVKEVKTKTLECYEFQDYPFDLLVDRLDLDRDLSQSPLFNVMLAHNNTDTFNPDLAMEGLTMSEYPYWTDFNMSKFDLIFFMVESDTRLEVNIEYNSDLFERSSIERMADNFLTLFDTVIENPEIPVYELNYINSGEYERIIDGFNDTAEKFPRLTLQELFQQQVERYSDKTAVVYHNQAVTYGELNKQSNQLAHYLREEHQVKPNDIIGAAVDRSLQMAAAILAILKAGAGYVAIDPNYPEERVVHMLEDSRARLLIIDEMRPELFGDYKGKMINIHSDWQAISRKSDRNPGLVNQPADILYVIYTSGSTGTPNGAMLSHGILTNLVHWHHKKTSIDGSLRCLQFTSINFCVSFQEIMTTLTAGGELHLIGDIQRQDIDYLMQFLTAHRIELLYLPFSYLNYLFNESSRWGQLYKHHLKHIVTAGEQLKISSGLRKFLELNPEIQLHNHYGSSEMHVVTSYTLDASTMDLKPVPPAGKPISNTKIFILDEYEHPVPTGVYGELFVDGSCEVLGYINNSALTDQKLLNHPFLSKEGKRLYRSGDLGRWLPDGNIELKGRKDAQVKVQGFRVEPGEIESKILSIENVTDCVVVVRSDEKGNKSLVAYVVVEGIEVFEIRKRLSKELPQHMLPEMMVLDALPLMPNGKVDRDRLPEPVIARQVDYVGPRSKMEEKLVEIWSEILGVEKELIGIDDNFFELGGHSLKAATVVSEMHKRLNVKVPLTEMFKTPTIRDLSGCVKVAEKDKYASIESAEEKEYYVLPPAQKRMYIIQQLDLGSITYNLPQVLHLQGELDVKKLEQTFQMLVNRHESFRTSFITVNGEPVREVYDSVEFRIEYFSAARSAESTGIVERFVRPFDLSQAPLLRVELAKIEEETFLLMIDMHHIIADGASYAIFVEELMVLYEGKQLPPLRVQYKDFAEWQKLKREKERESLKKAENHWLTEFEGEIPVLELPIDYPRPKIFSFEGSHVFFEIGEEETEALRRFIKEEDVTLFMVLLAVFYILLAKNSGQEDIVVGIPVMGRRHADLQPIIGMFVNTLAFRNYPGGNKTFKEFLMELKERALRAFDNQDYPFEELVDRLGMKRKTNRNALFDVMFGLQNLGDQSQNLLEIKIPGLELTPYEADVRVSRNDLCLYAYEETDRIDFMFEYSTKLFKPETTEILKDRYLILLKRILADPGCRIGDLDYRTEVEKELDRVEDVGFDF